MGEAILARNASGGGGGGGLQAGTYETTVDSYKTVVNSNTSVSVGYTTSLGQACTKKVESGDYVAVFHVETAYTEPFVFVVDDLTKEYTVATTKNATIFTFYFQWHSGYNAYIMYVKTSAYAILYGVRVIEFSKTPIE